MKKLPDGDPMPCPPLLHGRHGAKVTLPGRRAPRVIRQGAFQARSYFPAVSGKLLPETAQENSRARACKPHLASCEALCPARVMNRIIF